MNLSPDTHKVQSQLAKYCRDGVEVELPGSKADRLTNYRRLVFNIIQDNIESAYPITYKYLDTEIWNELVYDFFSIHECQSYQVWKLPKEFMDFVVDKNYAEKHNLPFLNDLLSFEWAEMELYNSADIPYEYGFLEGDVFKGSISFNPENILLSLKYPVHMLPPEKALELQGNYFVLLFREKDTGKIQFVDLSVWYAFLIEQINQSGATIDELLDYAPQLFGVIPVEELKASTELFIKSMIEKKFVIEIK
jgi:hypothetical protein